jgi:ribose transport system permease protein
LIALYALAFGIKGLQLTFTSNTIWIEPLFQGVSLLAAVSLASYRGVVRVPRRKSSQAPTTPSGDARDSVESETTDPISPASGAGA